MQKRKTYVRGSLNPNALARVLRGIAVSRKEGVLHLQRDDVSKRIYLKEGSIVSCDSDLENESLGEVMVRAGKLKRSDLEMAMKVMKETGERLGKTLAEMGLASPADLAALALERTQSMLHSLFLWTSGTYHFDERGVGVGAGAGAGAGDDVFVRLPAANGIFEAVRRTEDPALVRTGLGDLKAVLRRRANPLPTYEGSFNASIEGLLHEVNGAISIETIVGSSPHGEDAALRSIYALVLSGILEIESTEPAMAVQADGTRVTLGEKGAPPEPPQASKPLKTLGRYEVVRPLGRGAMGAVYLAKDPTIDRTVAIKLIQTAVQLTSSELETYRERFYREAKAAGKLLHPGIVTVFDVGHTNEKTPYIVMEYVEGQTLLDILQARKLGHEEVLKLAVQVLGPLAYAHSKGVVHRDIKPANILVTPDGDVKVMDFGIAHVVGSELTQADDILGSPNYMAPEQLSKGKIDARTDLFAFGVMLYRMLTGKLPFAGDSFATIAKAVLFDDPPAPAHLDRTISDALSNVVVRCLAKDPAARFQTANDLQTLLASSTGGAVSPATSTPHRPADARTGTPPRQRKQPQPQASARGGPSPALAMPLPRALRNPRILLATTVVFGLVLLIGFSLSRRPSDREAVAASGAAATATELVEMRSDEALYDEAVLALERGDLDASKTALEMLVRRNPGFDGGPELLAKVNHELRNHAPSPAETVSTLPPAAVSDPDPPGEAQLLYRATVAFERGDLASSKQQLEVLLRANPSLEGASELLVKVNDEIWKQNLPMSFRATHNHRLGSCGGTLTFAAWGIEYSSADHMWQWSFDEIRLMERDGRFVLNLETHETDPLSLGKPKNYKFEFYTPMRDEDWSRYRRLAR